VTLFVLLTKRDATTSKRQTNTKQIPRNAFNTSSRHASLKQIVSLAEESDSCNSAEDSSSAEADNHVAHDNLLN
jgi:hypothetical protein